MARRQINSLEEMSQRYEVYRFMSKHPRNHLQPSTMNVYMYVYMHRLCAGQMNIFSKLAYAICLSVS